MLVGLGEGSPDRDERPGEDAGLAAREPGDGVAPGFEAGLIAGPPVQERARGQTIPRRRAS